MAREMARAIERDGGGEIERERKKTLLGDPGVGRLIFSKGADDQLNS